MPKIKSTVNILRLFIYTFLGNISTKADKKLISVHFSSSLRRCIQ